MNDGWSGSDAEWMAVHRSLRHKERLAFLLAAIAFASALSLVVYSEVLPLLLDISATLDAVR
jgi:hypothetical protein